MPPIEIERPKLSKPMWNALKLHIIRERQRRKQELEAVAQLERLKREKDWQKERELAIQQTREQVAQSEQLLLRLRETKHRLFLQLV